jgi:hypothetical protein
MSIMGLRDAAPPNANPVAVNALYNELESIVSKGPTGGWVLNGVNGDSCLYNRRVFSSGENSGLLAEVAGSEGVTAFAYRAFIGGLMKYPGYYVSKVSHQIYAAIMNRNMNWRNPLEGAHSYLQFPELIRSPNQRILFNGIAQNPGTVSEIQSVPLLRDIGRVSHGLYALISVPSLLLAALVVILQVARGRFSRSMIPFVATATISIGAMATVALVHTFDVARYGETITQFAILSTMSAFAVLGSMLFPAARKTTKS